MSGVVWSATVAKAFADRLMADLAERAICLGVVQTRPCRLDIQKNRAVIAADLVKAKHTMPSGPEVEYRSSRFEVASQSKRTCRLVESTETARILDCTSSFVADILLIDYATVNEE